MLRLTTLAIIAWASVTIAVAQANAPDDFDVLHYAIVANVQFGVVGGNETIRFKSLVDGLQQISFTNGEVEVDRVKLERANRDAAKVAVSVEGNRRIFRWSTPLSAGETANVTFNFQSGRKGVVFSSYSTEERGITFRYDAIYANYFACDVWICDQDRTSDKATIELTLRETRGKQAVGPGRFLDSGPFYGGERTWRETRPTSAFLMGFAVGDFQSIRLPGIGPRLIVLAREGPPKDRVRKMFRDTRRMLKFFEQKSGVRYDAPEYTQVLVDGDEAQESARHSIIGRDNIEPILKDPKEDWVIAHELAHQWWGNSLTCKDWSELWLNEGFAVFMTAVWKEHRWGRAAYDHELELANKRWQAAKDQNFDVPLSWQGKYPSLKLKRAMAYAKSVVFLDTLRRQFGERTFWRAIKLYTRHNKDGVVTAKDLQTALETASRKDLTPLFAEWVFGTP